MQAHRESAATFAARIPVALLALTITTSPLHASCTPDSEGAVATQGVEVDAGDEGGDHDRERVPAEASVGSPSDSMDSPDDRADGMSYGDGYGAAGRNDERDGGTDSGADGAPSDAEADRAPDAADAGE